jgi:predicted Na+-dependent transporter
MRLVLDYLNKKSPFLMILGVVFGLSFPSVSELIRPHVVAISVFMAITSMVRIDPVKLFSVLKEPLSVATAMIFVLIILPCLTYFTCRFAGLSGWLTTGLTFASAAPPLSSAAAFALLVRIDPAIATGLSIPATIIAPFSVWFLTSTLPSLGNGVELSGLVFRLLTILIGSLICALLIRFFLGAKQINSWSDKIDALTVLSVTLIAIGVMHEIGLVMRSDPFILALVMLLASVISYGSLGLSVAAFWGAGTDKAFAVGLLSCVKNMAIMVAAVIDVVDPMIALVVICAQVPIFLSPLIMRSIFFYLQKRSENYGP